MTFVLIVDDKDENIYYLEALLTGHGCTVITARHGAEALVKARQNPPDLVISDLLMPVMDGYTLLRHWKADARLKQIPFIVYTATYTEPEDERLALNMGADAFILKPAEAEDFLIRLREVQANAAASVHVSPEMPTGDENGRFKLYSETLIRKLEEKTLQLESSNQALAQELAERKQAEEALYKSAQEFRTLADAMPQMVWITRPDGWNVFFNQQWMDYTGLTLEESLGHGWNKPFHPDDRQRASEAWQKATAGQSDYSLECRLRRADGAYRWWLIRGIPLKDAAGNILKWFGTCTDIDELKQTQIRVEDQAALLDAAHEAIFVKDLEDRITYWNKGAEALYGWSADEAIGCKSVELLYPDPTKFQQAHAVLLAHDEWQGEMLKRGNDGRDINVQVSWTLVRDAQGRPLSILAIDNDLTEKKKLEQQFLRAQRLDSVGTLAGGIAHDLNNVLAPILMSVEILKEMVAGNEDGLDLLTTLQVSAQRGADLVQQVLSFARGVKGERIAVNSLHLMNDLLKVMRDTFPKSIDLHFPPVRDLWNVTGDPTQLHQVFLNLCLNARDAMPNGGQLTMSMENVVLDETYAAMNTGARAGAYVMVTVADNGTGIPPEIRDQVFEPFFTTKEVGKGTGLGLSTTMAIVKSHEGFINLYSELGKGTKFKVYLPANTTETVANQAAIEQIGLPLGNGELVLVVDDEASIRLVTQRTLERFGYRVMLASHGAEAILLYAKHQQDIAIVLTDMSMPVMDGPMLIMGLKSMNPSVRIIGSSGMTSEGGVTQAMDVGMQHFIPKPYTAETLLRGIHRVLQQPEVQAPGPVAQQPTATTSVLIVDDKDEGLYYLQALLTGHGFKVDAARHGAEALVKARLSPPDLIISDLLMPVMDGYTLLRYWKADARLKQIPFIVYTATYTAAADETLALNLGADAFIRKPAEPEDFLIRIREMLANRAASIPHVPKSPVGDEKNLLKVYSENLIRKLEEKALQLQEANHALLQDIEARKAIEEKLRLLNSAVLQSSDSIMITDAELDLPGPRVIFVNPAFTRMTGYLPDEVFGKTPRILQGPRTDKAVIKRLRENLQGGEVFSGETVNYRKDGSEYDLEWKVTPIRDAGNRVTHFGAVQRDITQRKQAEASLRRSQALLRMAGRISRTGAWSITVPDFKLTLSEEACRIHDRSPDFAPTVEEATNYYAPECREMMSRAYEECVRSGTPFDIELELITAKGRRVWVRSIGEAERNADGVIERVQGAIQDITERKQAEIRIKYLNRVHAMLSGINSLIVRVRDRNELFMEACQIAIEMGGFHMCWIGMLDSRTTKIVPVAWEGVGEELMTSIISMLSVSPDSPLADTMAARAIRDKKVVLSNDSANDPNVLLGKIHAESGIRSVAVLPLIVSDQAVGVITLYASETEFFHEDELKLLTEVAGDIAFAIDHFNKQAQINYLAYYDVLTGLANRTLFLERVTQYMRSAVSGGHKLALVLIDLERFKNINDSFGQTAGDALLKQVSEWLKRAIGDVNLLTRVGADHFAVVLPRLEQQEHVARRLEELLERFLNHPFHLNDAVFRLAAKAGVALFPEDGNDADTLFKNAEAAIKKAKARGNRYLFYTESMTEAVARKLNLENQLRHALDNQEFVLHYQPKVDRLTNQLTGAEALIRWNDPRTGLVAPGQFIPILEETGLIFEVGRWAVRQAVDDYLRWRAQGLPALRIAVNVSPLQLRNPGFTDEIRQALAVDPRAVDGLELEITESLIMEDVRRSIASLEAIRDMGVTIAIDDFGTGFSSLNYLSKLPADKLKIDRSFVNDLTTGPQGLALVSTIINLAHALNLKVIAEGVETEEQASLLRLLNCDEMQGYLFSKPLPCEVFEARYLKLTQAGNNLSAN